MELTQASGCGGQIGRTALIGVTLPLLRAHARVN